MTLSRPGEHGLFAEKGREAECRLRFLGLSGMRMCVCLDHVESTEWSTGRRRSARENDDDRIIKAAFR